LIPDIPDLDNWIPDFKKWIPNFDNLFSNLPDIKSWNFFNVFNSCTETMDQVLDALPESTANQNANQQAAIGEAIEKVKINEKMVQKVEKVLENMDKSRKKVKKQCKVLTEKAMAYRLRLKVVREQLQSVLKNALHIKNTQKHMGQAQSNHIESLGREGMRHARRPAS
jgi:predicted transcriptional regulator